MVINQQTHEKGSQQSSLKIAIIKRNVMPLYARVGGSLRVLLASSTTKTGRHDIVEILLKVTLKHQKINQSIYE
jgi:hypothetical protein